MNKKNISLLVQVYNGGTYFLECLESIASCMDSFRHIYISINMSDLFVSDCKAADNFVLEHSDCSIIVFKRSRLLTSIQHADVFFHEVCKTDRDSDYFMILCHDDILSADFNSNIDKLLPKLSEDIVVNPARSFYRNSFSQDKFLGTYYGQLSFSNLITNKTEFANRVIENSPETSVSGLILSLACLKEYTSLFRFMNFGYYAEYLCMLNYKCKYVMGTDTPLVNIRKHSNSEGALVINEDKLRMDRFLYRYYLWYTINDPVFFKRLSFSIRSFSEFLYLLKLNIFLLRKTGKFNRFISFPFMYQIIKKSIKHIIFKSDNK